MRPIPMARTVAGTSTFMSCASPIVQNSSSDDGFCTNAGGWSLALDAFLGGVEAAELVDALAAVHVGAGALGGHRGAHPFLLGGLPRLLAAHVLGGVHG